jgi:glycosyltransferase involved in cell wall biosynthesis
MIGGMAHAREGQMPTGEIGDTRPLASVILCVRNSAATVGKQLQALARQECDGIAWELVVVDNNSTDATPKVVNEMLAAFPMARVETTDAIGLPHARNVGCEVARGALLLFCDGDDEVDEGWVAAMVRAAASADALGGALDRTRLNRPEWLVNRPARTADLEPWTGFLSYPGGANSAVRASVARALGGFDSSYVGGAEDVDFFWRAILAGYTVTFAPEAVVHYKERDTLRGLCQQFYRYGVQHPHLFRDFHDRGMPPSRWLHAVRLWAYLAVTAPKSWWSPAGRRQWVRLAARGAGRIAGSIRWRTLYL